MGHRNIQFTGQMIDMHTDQQGHLHPEPCIFYGNVPNFPLPNPNIHSVVPAPGNRCNFNFHPMPERRDGALFYGMPHLNGVQPQHPAPHLDLAVALPAGHYNPYVGPPSIHANHGIVGIPTDNYGMNVSFKRKNAQYHNNLASGSSSSSVAASESDVAVTEYGGSDVENGSVGLEPVTVRNGGRLVQGGFVGPPVGLPGNPWLDVRFGANGGDVGTFGWMHAPIPYVHALDVSASMNGASNRSSTGFMAPHFPQGHPNPHHPPPPPPPMQGMRGYNANLPSLVARRISTINSSNNGANAFPDMVDGRPTFIPPLPPMGFRLYRPHQREVVLDSSARHHTLPHLRVLPEDEVAILEIPGYHEAGDSVDQHRDMRLDIDHMSYEELLALEEQIGSVGTGLPEEFIRDYLKTRSFVSSAACLNQEEKTCLNERVNFCVICQTDYEDKDIIGTVDCGHEYHKDCIKTWLLMKNTCPVCKSTALTRRAKDL